MFEFYERNKAKGTRSVWNLQLDLFPHSGYDQLLLRGFRP